MKAKIYKGREVVGTVSFEDSKLTYDVKDQNELKKLKDIFEKPHETMETEDAEKFMIKPITLEPKTERHFEVVCSELWKFGYGHEWES